MDLAALVLLTAMGISPADVDSRTGMTRSRPKPAPGVRPKAAELLSTDTLRVFAYGLQTPPFLVSPAGIDLSPADTALWFLACWGDTSGGGSGVWSALGSLDPRAVPGQETLAVALSYQLTPVTDTAAFFTDSALAFSAQTLPFTSNPAAETVGGVSWRRVPGYPVHIDAGSAVWLTDMDSARVLRYEPETGTLAAWDALLYGMPAGVLADGQETWFADAEGALYRLATATNAMKCWIAPGSGSFGLGWPGIDLDPAGNVWLARRRDQHYIVRTKVNGDVAQFGIWTLPSEPADGPADVLVDGAGDAWYTIPGVDSGYVVGRIGRLSPETNVVTEWELPLPGSSPIKMRLDRAGNVFFVECNSCRVGRLDPRTNVLTEYVTLIEAETFGYYLALGSGGDVWHSHGWGRLVRLPGIGAVAEGSSASRRAHRVATVANETVWYTDGPRAELYGLDGRRRAVLHRGTNDVRHLSPGVYLLREDTPRGETQAARACCKVVIIR